MRMLLTSDQAYCMLALHKIMISDQDRSIRYLPGECLEISERAEAAMRFKESSGSWIQSTRRGTAPESTTDWANSALCRAM